MAYNKKNKLRNWRRIVEVYEEVKQDDIPDTFIVAKIFPKYNIFISIRTWVTIKGMKPSELDPEKDQLSLF